MKYSTAESGLLRELAGRGYRYIARDGDGALYAYREFPLRHNGAWYTLGAMYPLRADSMEQAVKGSDQLPLDIFQEIREELKDERCTA